MRSQVTVICRSRKDGPAKAGQRPAVCNSCEAGVWMDPKTVENEPARKGYDCICSECAEKAGVLQIAVLKLHLERALMLMDMEDRLEIMAKFNLDLKQAEERARRVQR